MLVLITGGARSGKSSFAESYAACLGRRGYYIATCRQWDQEMEERVAMHRKVREGSGFPWETVEEPMDLPGALEGLEAHGQGQSGSGESGGEPPVILVDCLTLWLSNLLLADSREEWTGEARRQAGDRIQREVDRLLGVVRRQPGPVLLVTNEVGGGIVPEYPLGRLFRDLSGRMNQRIAAASDQTFLVTAGIAVELKHQAFRLPPSRIPPEPDGR